jgi:quercetin dioxygenase-like cupin family protein
MKHFAASQVPFEPADPRNFVGNARVKRLPLIENQDTEEPRAARGDGAPQASGVERGEGPPRLNNNVVVFLVEFEPGGRTNWHRHSAPQLLLVTEGRGRLQKWGEPPRDIGAGDAISIEPNEKHWHGAAPGTKMAHFAVNVSLTTEWLEPVSDDQYRAS